MGGDLGFDTLDELHEEMGRLLAPHEPERVAMAFTDPVRPERAEGTLALFTYPLLVDEGRLSERADELKEALEDQAFVEVHPDDAGSLGLADGGRAVVRTDAGEAELPVRVTEHVAAGSVFVPFNNPGLQANKLLSGSFTAAASLEAVAVPAGQEVSA
jgi:predicted molibdopterin-dependent oxidoreductase YjgC